MSAVVLPDPVEAFRLLLYDHEPIRAETERIYGDAIPERVVPAMPGKAIVVRPAPGVSVFGGGSQHYGDIYLDVFCYGRTRRESFDVYRVVQPFLKRLTTTKSDGCLIYWARRSGGSLTLTDPDSEWPYTFSSWQVLLAEEGSP